MSSCAPQPCRPVLYLDGATVRVLRIDHCARHAQVDNLMNALQEALLL
jgi:hypothetical protein